MFLICLLVACESEVTISIDGGYPPVFRLERHSAHVNYLDFFIVKEVAPENQNVPYTKQNPDKNIILWQIWPKGTDEGTIRKLPPITYGKLPDGFVQKVPQSGEPPALMEGKIYEAGGPPVIMPRGFIRFIIRDGKSIEVPVPGER